MKTKHTGDENATDEPAEPAEPDPDKNEQPDEPAEPSKLTRVDEPTAPAPETDKVKIIDEPTAQTEPAEPAPEAAPPTEANEPAEFHSFGDLITEYKPAATNLPTADGVDPAGIIKGFADLQTDIAEAMKGADEPDVIKKPAFTIPRGALNPFRGPVVDNSRAEPAKAGAINGERLFRLTKTAGVLADTVGKSSFKNLAGEIQRSRKDYISIYDRIIEKHPFAKKMAIDVPELELVALGFKNIKAARDARQLAPLKTPPARAADSDAKKPARSRKPARGKKPVSETKNEGGTVPLKIDVNKIQF